MSKLVVNEVVSVDNSPVDFPDGITINGEQLASLGGGADLSGKLEWGYPLGLFQGVKPTVPTITGNTWTHTIEEDVASPVGTTLPAVGYSALLPQLGYVEFNLSLPAGHADFYVMLYNDRPALHPAFGEISKDCIVVTVSTTGISLVSSLDQWSLDVPNTQGVTSFGISASMPSAQPRLHVNGTSYEIEVGNYTANFSIATAYMGQVGEQLSVTLDPVSTVHQDPANSDSFVTMSELPVLTSPAMYGVPQTDIGSTTLSNTSDQATYQVSPRRLNEWFNGKALTQADIDNATSNKGLVSGEQLASIGGGGTEVLKDWTRVVSPNSINLLGSVDLSQGTNGITVEFRDLAIDNVIGYWNGRLAWNTESNELPTDKRESLTHTVVGQANPVVVNRDRPSDFSNNFMYAPATAGSYQLSAQIGNMTIELESLTRTIGGVGLSTATAYVTSGTIISWIPNFATANGILKSYSIVQGNSKNTTPFTKLFLGWDSGATVDYEYRVIRK